MKGVAFFEHGPVDVLQYLEDFPDPVAGKSDKVIIDIKHCGINHLDIWTRRGIGAADKKIRLPHIYGCNIVGTTTIKGQRVMIYPVFTAASVSTVQALVIEQQQQEEQEKDNNNGNNKHENLCSQFAIIRGFSDYNGGYAERVAVPEKMSSGYQAH
jgi:NADPH:quinone reductase-like Zn-dependent oxidoreductase